MQRKILFSTLAAAALLVSAPAALAQAKDGDAAAGLSVQAVPP